MTDCSCGRIDGTHSNKCRLYWRQRRKAIKDGSWRSWHGGKAALDEMAIECTCNRTGPWQDHTTRCRRYNTMKQRERRQKRQEARDE